MAETKLETKKTETHRVDLAYRRSTFSGGTTAGLVAGVITALVTALYGGIVGMGFLTPFKLTAAGFLGTSALVGSGGTVLLGVGLYLLASAFWGWVFASFVSRNTTPGAAFWGGLLFGVAVWAIETFISLPLLNRVMESRVAMMPGYWFFENLLFGCLLYMTPAYKRRYGEATIHHGS